MIFLYLKTVESLLFVNKGLSRGSILANDENNNNPTPCQLAVVNKVNIQNKTPIPHISIIVQWHHCHYAEQIKYAVKVRAQTQNNWGIDKFCLLFAFGKT